MSERLGKILHRNSGKAAPPDLVYKRVFGHIKKNLLEKAENSSKGRVLIPKLLEITEQDFDFVLTDHSHPDMKRFVKWLENEKLSFVLVAGGVVVRTQPIDDSRTGLYGNDSATTISGHIGTSGVTWWSIYKEKIDQIERDVKQTANIVIDIVKLIGIASPIIGFILLAFYLRRATASFPVIDSSLSIFLTVISFVFTMLFALFIDILVIVEVCKGFVRRDSIRKFVPNLRPESPFPDPPSYTRLKKAMIDYVKLYACFLITVCLLIMTEFRSSLVNLLQNTGFNNQVLIDLYHNLNASVVRFLPPMSSTDTHVLLSFIYGFAIGALIVLFCFRNIKMFLYSTLGSFISLIWFFYSYVVFGIFASIHGYSSVIFLTVITFLMSCHLMANVSVQKTSTNVTAFCSLFLFISLVVWPGPSVWGALVLRALGVGGGVPATFQIRSISDVDGRITGRTFRGCLILMTSNQLVVREIKGKENETVCGFKSDIWEKDVVDPIFSRADIYLRSDVIRIFGLH